MAMRHRARFLQTLLAMSKLLRLGMSVQGGHLLPLHLQCWNTPRYWKAGQEHEWGDAKNVWHSLGFSSSFRADSTCCSVDKVRTVLDYAKAILALKSQSMEDQEAFSRTLAGMISRSDSRNSCPNLISRSLNLQIAAHAKAVALARQAFRNMSRIVFLTLRIHCLLPRRASSLMSSERLLRSTADRLAQLTLELSKEAAALVSASILHTTGEGSSCFPAPFLVSLAGVGPPEVSRQEAAQAITYPFSRNMGSVRMWHAWIDRFSLVFSLFPAKLTHQIKAITSGFEPATVQGPSRWTFWVSQLSVEPGAHWRWPNHAASRQLRAAAAAPVDLALVLLVSNRTCAGTVDRLWSETELVLDTVEERELRVLWLEDSLREPWVTAERPVHAVWLAQSARNLVARRGGIGKDVMVVWRRHQNTLDNDRVARIHIGGDLSPCRQALVYEARNSGSGDTGCNSAGATPSDVLPGGKLALPLVTLLRSLATHEPSRVIWPKDLSLMVPGSPQDTSPKGEARHFGSIAWATAGLTQYVSWHKQVVDAWQVNDPGGPRVLVYVCNPFSLCGGHGDRTNGILSAFILALLTSRAFFIESDSPLPLSLALQPRRGEDGRYLVDWRLRGGAVGSASQSSYIDDRLAFQEDLAWLVHDPSRVVLISMNHREVGALLSHPRLQARAEALGLRHRPDLYARLWATLFEPAPPLRGRLLAAQQELGLAGPFPWEAAEGQAGSPAGGFLAIHFRAGNESARSWWDPGRHPLSSIQTFLDCADYVEQELGLPEGTKWLLSADTAAVLQTEPVAQLQGRGKLVVLGEDWRIVHVDRSSANLGFEGFVDSYVSYVLLASARAVVLSRSYFGETAAEVGASPDAYFAEGCVRVDLTAS